MISKMAANMAVKLDANNSTEKECMLWNCSNKLGWIVLQNILIYLFHSFMFLTTGLQNKFLTMITKCMLPGGNERWNTHIVTHSSLISGTIKMNSSIFENKSCIISIFESNQSHLDIKICKSLQHLKMATIMADKAAKMEVNITTEKETIL